MLATLPRQFGPIDLGGVLVLHAAALAAVLLLRTEPAPSSASAPIVAQLIQAPAAARAVATQRLRHAQPLAMRSLPRTPKAQAAPPTPAPRPAAARTRRPVIATTADTAPRATARAPRQASKPRPPRPAQAKAEPVVETPPRPSAAAAEPAAVPPPVAARTAAPGSAPEAPAAAAATATAPTAAARRAAGSTGAPSDNRAYFAAILQRLNRYKVYPAALRKEKIEGLVVMKFTIRADGEVVAASIQRSSGSTALDRAAQDMLARASPLPAIPASIGKDALTLSVPVEYSLLTDR